MTSIPLFMMFLIIIVQLRLPIISSFASHAVLLSFGVAQEHSTLVVSNLDGAHWALTSDGIHFVAISPFEKISPRSTITMELAGRLPILSSASLHDSQAAIPLIQMSSARAKILYDLADCAYDAEEIKAVSKKMGHIPVIDPNPRRGGTVELPPARKIRYRERSTVERVNSDLKDNYGARHVRVKGHWKVLCHLMFGVIAITVKQLFNMLE